MASPEYEKLITNGSELCDSFKEGLSDLLEILVNKEIISPDNKEEIVSKGKTMKADGAARLLELLRNKVKVDRANYHKFVAGLKERAKIYNSILKIMYVELIRSILL